MADVCKHSHGMNEFHSRVRHARPGPPSWYSADTNRVSRAVKDAQNRNPSSQLYSPTCALQSFNTNSPLPRLLRSSSSLQQPIKPTKEKIRVLDRNTRQRLSSFAIPIREKPLHGCCCAVDRRPWFRREDVRAAIASAAVGALVGGAGRRCYSGCGCGGVAVGVLGVGHGERM